MKDFKPDPQDSLDGMHTEISREAIRSAPIEFKRAADIIINHHMKNKFGDTGSEASYRIYDDMECGTEIYLEKTSDSEGNRIKIKMVHGRIQYIAKNLTIPRISLPETLIHSMPSLHGNKVGKLVELPGFLKRIENETIADILVEEKHILVSIDAPTIEIFRQDVCLYKRERIQ